MSRGLLHLPAATLVAAAAAASLSLPSLYKPPSVSRGPQSAAATTGAAADAAAAAAAGAAESPSTAAAAAAAAIDKSPLTETPSRGPLRSVHSLCRCLVEDAFAAGCASLCISPAVTLIDRAIVVSAAGHKGLMRCLCEGGVSAARQPLFFFRSQPFAAVFAVYAGTYFAANSAETLASACGANVASIRFLSTTACNIALCVRKDVIFSRLFGGPSHPLKRGPSVPDRNFTIRGPPSGRAPRLEEGAPPESSGIKPFPKTSVGLFLARDGLTIAAAFNAPPYFAAFLSKWVREEGEERAASGAPIRTRGPPVFGTSCLQSSTTIADRLHGTQPLDAPHQHHNQQQQQQQQQQEEEDGILRGGQLRSSEGDSASTASSREPLGRQPLRQLQEWLRGDPETVSFLSYLVSPLLVQFVSTPLHLLSLDLYNRPSGLASQRLQWILSAYLPAVCARAARIVPAFGIGGFVNSRARAAFSAFDPGQHLDGLAAQL
ncbi:hypothetical protein Emag_004274 [Eimeria magna]